MEYKFCTQCGKPLKEGMKFCTSCGKKMAQPEAETANEEVSADAVSIKIPEYKFEDDFDYTVPESEFNDEPVAPPPIAPTPVATQTPVTPYTPVNASAPAVAESPAKKSHTWVIILISVVATLLIIAAGIFAWLYYTDRLGDLQAMFMGTGSQVTSNVDEDEEILGPDAYVDETAPLPTENGQSTEEPAQEEPDEEYTTIKKKDKDRKEEIQEEPEIVQEEEPEPEPEKEPDYIIPDSDSRLITEDDLRGLSADECRIARNEIYARHGRRFTDEGLQAYFDSKDWYRGTIDPSKWKESTLNKTERTNTDTITKYEKKKGYR